MHVAVCEIVCFDSISIIGLVRGHRGNVGQAHVCVCVCVAEWFACFVGVTGVFKN